MTDETRLTNISNTMTTAIPREMAYRMASVNEEMSLTATEIELRAMYLTIDMVLEDADKGTVAELAAGMVLDEFNEALFNHSTPRIISNEPIDRERSITLAYKQNAIFSASCSLLRILLEMRALTDGEKAEKGLDPDFEQVIESAWKTVKPQWQELAPGFGQGVE